MNRPTRATTPARTPLTFSLHADTPLDGRAWGWAGLLVIAAYAVAALVMVFGPHRIGDILTETDFYGSYGPGARALLKGHLDPTRYGVQGPMFEFALAAVGLVVRDLFVAAQLVSLAGMVTMLVSWRALFTRWLGHAGGALAVALLAVNLWAWRFAWSATTDALALGLQALALWLLVGGPEGRTPDLRRTGLAGLLAGLAFLTRYNFVVLLPAGLAVVALGWSDVPREQRPRHLLAFVIGALLPVAPWFAFSASHGGLTRGQLHMNIAYEVYARPKGIVLDVFQRDMESQFPNLWSVIARDPLAVITRMVHNLFEHLWLDARQLVGLPVALAAGVGAWLAARQGTLARMRPLLLVCGLLFLSLVPAPHGERYSLAVLPLWIGLAAALLVSGSFALTLGPARLKLLLVPVLLALSLRDTVALTRRTLDQLPVEVLDAAAQIHDQVHPGDKVFARKPHFAWYAGLTPVAMPLTDRLADWGTLAKQGHVRWLYFSWPEAQLRPAFEWLLDSTSATPGLTVRGATAHWPALVYEVGDDFGIEPGWLASDTLSAVHRAKARVQLDPHNAETRVFLAMRAFESGDHEEAQRWIDELLVIGPRDPDILLLAAENRLQLKDPEGALSYYQRADVVKPGTPEVRIGYGWVAAMQGDDATAAQYWGPVIGASADPITLQRMMLVFARLGDTAHLAQARAALEGLGRTR